MDQKGYCLIFEGRVLPGFSRREVINRVAIRLGRSPENLKRLFQDKPVTVRQGLDKEKALGQQKIFSKMGVCCHIWPKKEQEQENESFNPAPARSSQQCPKCGNDLTKFGTQIDECPFCGIIISKYLRKAVVNNSF
ncbi:MAG: hypothetical protein K9J79_11200 [Desulfobacteraceae bacterium]|nr:hypothetical protein [Desulfobacteraceae bacterium]MCF8095914.1 hypothetical protein [Desulfobacteraceae bacterium]